MKTISLDAKAPKPISLQSITGEHEEAPDYNLRSEIERLAALSPLDYDRIRRNEAKRLQVRPSTLDDEVKKARLGAVADTGSLVEELEPWPEPVAASEVLREIFQLLNRHVILPTGADIAIPLWILGAFAYEPLRIFPKLLITSPEKRCGKTTLLETINALAPRALLSSSISAAVIYRVVEKHRPTLIIDEADTFVAGNDELRGIINSGHTKASASVIRCEGDNHEPRKYSTWAPMALASIKLVGDTITDRSIVIQLRRKMNGESVEKLPPDLFDRRQPLRRKLQRWADENAHRVKAASPALPDSPNDRALDNWTPLFAISDLAGGEWPQRAREAFAALTRIDEDSESAGILLLGDVRAIFEERGVSTIWSTDLVDDLIEMEERPWSEWKRGRPMTVNSLSKLLSPFRVRSRQLKHAGTNKRGYDREDFEEAFTRYL